MNDTTYMIAELFSIRDQAHWLHLTTSSYMEHKELGDYYEKFLELADDLIECAIAGYGVPELAGFTVSVTKVNTLSFVENVAIKLKEMRGGGPDMDAIIDEMLKETYKLKYKIKFLRR